MNQGISFLTDPTTLTRVNLKSVDTHQHEPSLSQEPLLVIKPRRRLGDTTEDALLGGLIQKTKAIQIEVGEEKVIISYLMRGIRR